MTQPNIIDMPDMQRLRSDSRFCRACRRGNAGRAAVDLPRQRRDDSMSAAGRGGDGGRVPEHYANVHRGVYRQAERTTEQFESAQTKVQRFIHAPSPEQIIFTSAPHTASTWSPAVGAMPSCAAATRSC